MPLKALEYGRYWKFDFLDTEEEFKDFDFKDFDEISEGSSQIINPIPEFRNSLLKVHSLNAPITLEETDEVFEDSCRSASHNKQELEESKRSDDSNMVTERNYPHLVCKFSDSRQSLEFESIGPEFYK